jgi:hypothetical protein
MILIVATLWIAKRKGVSPVEIFSVKTDKQVVKAFGASA